MNNLKMLVWEDRYSVEVEEIDAQHKVLLATINKIVEIISNHPTEEKLKPILASLMDYKKFHFETEEKYFKQFNFEGSEEHIKAHESFGVKIAEIQDKHRDDPISMTFDLVDFLEDWLLDHMMNMDQKYVECFAKNGLK